MDDTRGSRRRRAAEWLEAGKVGIDWDFGGVDIASMSRDEMKAAYAEANGETSGSKVGSAAGQAYRFAHDMAEGSTVVMYDPSTRLYHAGEVAGPCIAAAGEGVTYERAVRWQREAPRDRLSAASRNSLGSIMTIFQVGPDVMADLARAWAPGVAMTVLPTAPPRRTPARPMRHATRPSTTASSASRTGCSPSAGMRWRSSRRACFAPWATTLA